MVGVIRSVAGFRLVTGRGLLPTGFTLGACRVASRVVHVGGGVRHDGRIQIHGRQVGARQGDFLLHLGTALWRHLGDRLHLLTIGGRPGGGNHGLVAELLPSPDQDDLGNLGLTIHTLGGYSHGEGMLAQWPVESHGQHLPT